MKFPITLSVFAFVISMSTVEAQGPPIPEPEFEELEGLKPIPEPSKKKFKHKKNMIAINPIRGNYTVKIGQQVYYSTSVHGSVGYTASAFSSDDKALPLNRSFLEYNNKQKSGMTGGDSATQYFIFDAAKVGTYEITIQHSFRGNLEDQSTITIKVE